MGSQANGFLAGSREVLVELKAEYADDQWHDGTRHIFSPHETIFSLTSNTLSERAGMLCAFTLVGTGTALQNSGCTDAQLS